MKVLTRTAPRFSLTLDPKTRGMVFGFGCRVTGDDLQGRVLVELQHLAGQPVSQPAMIAAEDTVRSLLSHLCSAGALAPSVDGSWLYRPIV